MAPYQIRPVRDHEGRGREQNIHPEQCLTLAPRQAQDVISTKTKQNTNQNGHGNLSVLSRFFDSADLPGGPASPLPASFSSPGAGGLQSACFLSSSGSQCGGAGVILPEREHLATPGDIFVVITGEGVLLSSSGQRPGILVNIPGTVDPKATLHPKCQLCQR